MTNTYETPLSSRYASDYMLKLFSSDTRYQTWRKLWVALAKAENALGLPVSKEQVKELSEHITDIDYDVVAAREKEVRHDVMAHVYAYGKVAPSAAGIIHLGATSCYVTDNADLVIYRDGLRYLRGELLKVISNLCEFADKYKALPTLGYTHYQPAQLVTVGKRACLWMQDFLVKGDVFAAVVSDGVWFTDNFALLYSADGGQTWKQERVSAEASVYRLDIRDGKIFLAYYHVGRKSVSILTLPIE